MVTTKPSPPKEGKMYNRMMRKPSDNALDTLDRMAATARNNRATRFAQWKEQRSDTMANIKETRIIARRRLLTDISVYVDQHFWHACYGSADQRGPRRLVSDVIPVNRARTYFITKSAERIGQSVLRKDHRVDARSDYRWAMKYHNGPSIYTIWVYNHANGNLRALLTTSTLRAAETSIQTCVRAQEE